MSGRQGTDAEIRDWLRDVLDPVGFPDDAVRGALGVTAVTPQPAASAGWRERWWRIIGGVGDARASREPEVVLTPASIAASPSGPAGTMPLTMSPPIGIGLAIAVIGIALAASLAVFLAVGGPGAFVGPGATATTAPTPWPASGEARTIRVLADGNGDATALADALVMARDGDTISLAPGTYDASVVITKDVTIRGDGPRQDVVIRPGTPGPGDPAWVASFAGQPPNEGLAGRGRYVLLIRDADVILEDLTIVGAEVGTAVYVEGGASILRRITIDPVGEQAMATGADPHEALSLSGGTAASVIDSDIEAFVSISDGATSRIEGSRFDGACIYIQGQGTRPILSGNRIVDSRCPNFAVGVLDGATPSIIGNRITGTNQRGDAIRVHGAGSDAIVRDNEIVGGLNGIWIGNAASPEVSHNRIEHATNGIVIDSSGPVLTANEIRGGNVGLSVIKGATPMIRETLVCDAAVEVDVDGSSSPDIDGTRPCSP